MIHRECRRCGGSPSVPRGRGDSLMRADELWRENAALRERNSALIAAVASGPATCWRSASAAGRSGPPAAPACCSAKAPARLPARCCGSKIPGRCPAASPTRWSSPCATRSGATCAIPPAPTRVPGTTPPPCRTSGRATSRPSVGMTTGSSNGRCSDRSPRATCGNGMAQGTSPSHRGMIAELLRLAGARRASRDSGLVNFDFSRSHY